MIRKAAAGTILLGALYFLFFGGDYTFLDLWRLDREREEETAELEAVRAEVDALEQKVDSLATDSSALERLAREQFGLIREGERLYRFVEPDSVDGEPRAGEPSDGEPGDGEGEDR